MISPLLRRLYNGFTDPGDIANKKYFPIFAFIICENFIIGNVVFIYIIFTALSSKSSDAATECPSTVTHPAWAFK